MIFEMFRPVHRWIWSDTERRARKLLRFGETETDGGRDLVRASEKTSDPLLRRLYLEHAIDEHRHGVMFRRRGNEILRALTPGSKSSFAPAYSGASKAMSYLCHSPALRTAFTSGGHCP